VCNLEENLLFSTLILGSVFSDYVVFNGDIYSHTHPDRLHTHINIMQTKNLVINKTTNLNNPCEIVNEIVN